MGSMNNQKIKVGIVGTGYAATKRAEALKLDARVELMTAMGSNAELTQAFCDKFELKPSASWLELVHDRDLDLIFICTINQLHYPVALEALRAKKHVVVEYPLALNPDQAQSLIDLAYAQQLLLHVEHIELLGGVHQAIAEYLPQLGKIFYARYVTFVPQFPAPLNWKYHYESFGFPLIAALSRIHRLTDLLGTVDQAIGNNRYWDAMTEGYFKACFCHAQLTFHNQASADVIYGKGEVFVQRERTFELHGEQGSMIFEGETGVLITSEQKISIEVKPRRGLFQQDTTLVLDYLTSGKPLYLKPEQSLYALKIAHLAQQGITTSY
jgi:biliverdin reductase